MTPQEIQERNEQIALMLGYRLITPDMRRNPDKWNMSYWQKDYPEKQDVLCSEKYLPFHSDWNWLMEVVEFINNLKIKTQTFYLSITRSNVWIYQYKNHTTKCPTFSNSVLDDGKFKPLKETLFIAVSDFAKLYNNKEL